MRKQFDIKYRPQIESGEYKVVTGDNRPVRIISWDKHVYGGRFEIVALVPANQGDTETCQMYNPDGSLIASPWNEKHKLFILTDEPELTEFEMNLRRCIVKHLTTHIVDSDGNTMGSTVFISDDTAKAMASDILALAKKELCKGCVPILEGYASGRKDALKEMEENRVYTYEGPAIQTYFPPCFSGGPCTNPMGDCINCPRQSTVGINTTTGTSTAKVEEKK